MSALSSAEIKKRLFHLELDKRLVVSPILSEDQISHGTIDIRIGNEFIIPKRSDAHIFDPLNFELMKKNLLKTDREYIPIGKQFHLHPNKVVLCGSIEYFSIPTDLLGRVQVRSSYDRLGVNLSTLANPGYKGSLTLSLVNVGNTPVVLYPGIRIAQMTLFSLLGGEEAQEEYRGKYRFEIGPVFSRAHEDGDLKIVREWLEDE